MGRGGAAGRLCPGLRRRGRGRSSPNRFALAEVERFSLAPGPRLVGGGPPRGSGALPVPGLPSGAVRRRGPAPGSRPTSRPGGPGGGRRLRPGRPDVRAIKEALEEFGGISRGFESRGSYRGVTLVDDEAPGPLAVGEALAVAREVFGRRRLWAAYRPGPVGDASWPLASEFAEADRVWIIDEEGPSARLDGRGAGGGAGRGGHCGRSGGGAR